MQIANQTRRYGMMKKTKSKTAKKNKLRVRVFAFNLMKIKEDELNEKLNTFLATINDPEPVISIDRDEVSLIFVVEYNI